jgi:hypothetical protein
MSTSSRKMVVADEKRRVMIRFMGYLYCGTKIRQYPHPAKSGGIRGAGFVRLKYALNLEWNKRKSLALPVGV